MTGENSYPNPDNYPVPSFKSPVPAPDIDPDAGDLIFVGYNPEWQKVLEGALMQLLLPSTWDGTDEEKILALNRAETLRWMLTEQLAVMGDVPAPFWDDKSGEDAGDELPPGEQPWYEELSHWILAGFLAVTFTPAAGIFYLTYIRPARIQFRARNYGAVAEILVDGIMQGEVDTYSPTDEVIYYDFNIPVSEGLTAFDVETHEIEVRHSGTANANAEPTEDGYAIEVIRDYIGRDKLAAPVSRINPDTGEFEYTPDNGETWIVNPDADPRNQITFPPLTGTDERCRAAASATAFLENFFSETLVYIGNGGTVLGGAWFVLALLEPTFFGELIWAIWTFFTAFIIDIGVSTITAELDEEAYDRLRCIFRALYDDEGRFPPANLPKLYAALYDELPVNAAQVIDLAVDGLGFGGLSNIAAQDLDPMNPCACCFNHVEDFTTAPQWFTTIGANPFYPANETGGVYDGSFGKTAPGSAKGTLHNSAQRITCMIDLGKPCTLSKQVFSVYETPFVGGTPFNWRMWYVGEAGNLISNINQNIGAPSSWTTITRFDTTANVRYVIIACTAPTTATIYLDDINIEVS